MLQLCCGWSQAHSKVRWCHTAVPGLSSPIPASSVPQSSSVGGETCEVPVAAGARSSGGHGDFPPIPTGAWGRVGTRHLGKTQKVPLQHDPSDEVPSYPEQG